MRKFFTHKGLCAFLAAAAALTASEASALVPYSFQTDGIYYRITGAKTVAVSYGSEFKASYKTADVVIPATVTNEGTTYDVTEVADSAFFGCTAVTSITIPKSIKRIGNRAFMNATKIKTTNIEDLNAWLSIDFDDNTVYSTPVRYSCDLTLNGKTVTEVTFPDTTTVVPAMVLAGCESITKVALPKTVKKIGKNAFYSNKALVDINLPESVEEIHSNAFYNCYALKKITLPSGLKKISRSCFYSNKALVDIKLPDNLELIDSTAFWMCTSLTSIKLPASLKKIGRQAFAYCSALANADIPEGVTFVDYQAYRSCSKMSEAFLPASIDTMATAVFSYCPIKKLTIADSREVLKASTSLTGHFFYRATLDTLYIGRDIRSTCTTAGKVKTVFEGISGVKVLTVGAYVTDITQLYGTLNTTIDSITLLGTVPPAATEFAEATYKSAKLVVPAGSKSAYQAADVWKNFVNIEEASVNGISNATATAGNSTPVYYTIQGVRVDAPANGIFIKVQDGKAVKVLF